MKITCKPPLLSTLLVLFGTAVTNAVEKGPVTVYWRHATSTTVIEIIPPVAGGSGWKKLAEGGSFTESVGPGEVIWLACRNDQKAKFRKSWEISVDSGDATKKPYDFFGDTPKVYGYLLLANGKWRPSEVPKARKTKRNRFTAHESGTKWTIKAEIGSPQPGWEVLRLKRDAVREDITLTVTATAGCWDPKNSASQGGTGAYDVDMSFGAIDAMVRQVAVTELVLFPVNVPPDFDSDLSPTLLAPPASGTWTYRIANIDPDGKLWPHPGVWWSTDGPGIAAAEVFNMTLPMLDNGDDAYLLFAYDSVVDSWHSTLQYIGVDSIPALSLWGLVITALLLLVGARIFFNRQRMIA